MAVRERVLLEAAARVLAKSPAASMAEIAAVAGVSRTTLHARFANRHDLLVALAQDAMDQVEAAYREAGLDGPDVRAALGRTVELLMPLGAQIEFLLRERSLDDDDELTRRYAGLDRPVVEAVARGQRDGALRADLPAWWLVAALSGTVYAAWEAIVDGRLAPRDAVGFVLAVVFDGAAPR